MTKTLFVDLDDTLLLPGRFSRFYWRMAKWFQRKGRGGQRPNPVIRDLLARYDRVVVVSSRDSSDLEESIQQLRRGGISVAEVRFCPRREVFRRWKENTIDELAEDGSVDWVDDLFDGEGPVTLSRTLRPGEIHGLPATTGPAKRSPSDLEPPSL